MAIEDVRPIVRVEIDGEGRTLLGGSATVGTRAAFATATLLLDPAEGRPRPGQRLAIFAGYDGRPAPICTVEIDANGVSLAPAELEVRGTGLLGRTRETIGTPPTVVDGEAEREYVLTWSGATAGQMIADVLDEYGIAEYILEDDGSTYGNLEPIGLTVGDSGWSLIEQLDEAEGYRTWDGPDGVVRRTPLAGIPGSVGRTFEQGTDLFAGRFDESRVGTYNRVIASGLPQEGSLGIDFTPTTILDAPSPWIPSPPTYRAFSWSSYLFETEAQTAAYAARKLGELNRLRGELPFDLLLGDETLRPGMSVAVESLVLDVRAGMRFWVIELVHSFDDGFNTAGTLLAASEGTGWGANQAPVAIIAAVAKQETLADGSEIVAISLDGSASYDPELGVAGIVSYAWSGSPITPDAFDSAMRATVVYAGGIPDGATITLTVTDNLGKTGATTIRPAEGGWPVKRRDLISAELTRLQTTRDGGATWTGVTDGAAPIAAVGTCEFAAAEYTFAWDAAGTLYKVLADDTASAVLSGAGITACGISLAAGDPTQPTGRVWATSADGAVYRSRADGDAGTWEAVAPAPNGEAATYIAESPFAEGDIELAAGRVSYRSFDNGANWTEQYAHPNTALTAYRIAAGFGKSWIGFNGPDGDDLGASRLIERDDAVALDWPEVAKPASVVGLALDPFEDAIYVLDRAIDGNGRFWRGDSAAGGLLEQLAVWDPAWGEPRHMIRDGTSAGYLYIAAENALLKSVDGLQTILVLKNLAGGAEGMMLGYGAEHPARVEEATIVSAAGRERALSLWNGAANDAPPANWYALAFDDSAWGLSVEIASPAGGVVEGAMAVWTQPTVINTQQALFRRTFTLPVGEFSGATLRVRTDNHTLDVYLNGTRLGGDTADLATKTYGPEVVKPLLISGGTNVIAIRGAETSGVQTQTSFRLDAFGGA